MRSIIRHGGFLAVALTMALAGCVDGPSTSNPTGSPTRTSGLALTADVLGSTDIGGMKFQVTAVACSPGGPVAPGGPWTAEAQFEDLYLPGGMPLFEQKPYDGNSTHIFADHYFLLPAGCFNVLAQPLNQQGANSGDCYAAHKSHVQVSDGQTTEVTIISQCQGPPRGGLDVVASVNHPPQIEDVSFNPSKFVSSCQGTEVCVTASDPDGDPIEFDWQQTAGGPLQSGPTVSSTTMNNDGSVTQCGVIQTGAIDDYAFKLTTYDLAYDDNGLVTRIENLLSAQGDNHQSRDDIEFPIHAGVDCPVQGRTVTMMLDLADKIGPSVAQAQTLVGNAIHWVNPSINPDPNILVVLARDNNGEFIQDPRDFIKARAESNGLSHVDTMLEPASGLQPADLKGYQIVWFANPGYPMDKVSTYNSLMGFIGQGGGLILEGDDMGQFQNLALSMTPFTKLVWLSNGVTTCGYTTNNDLGANYRVTFNDFAPGTHPLIAGLEGQSFLYGNDIDHTRLLLPGDPTYNAELPAGSTRSVVARARLANRPCPGVYPVIVGYDPP